MLSRTDEGWWSGHVIRAFRVSPRLLVAVAVLVTCAGCSPAALLNVTSGGLPEGGDRAVAYGDLPRQRYDVYRPERVFADTPVIVFFYGGSWSGGSRESYAFVGNALADEGFMTAIVDYRVYPDVIFPVFVEDAAKAVLHIKNSLGADRDLFLAGHSAGAHIAALLAFDTRYLTRDEMPLCPPVRGFIGLSGPYDFLPLRRQRYREIFPQALGERSQPVNHLSADSPPTLVVHGTGDTLVVPGNSTRLAVRLRAHGVQVTTLFLEGAGHVKPVAALADALDFLAPVRSAVTTFVSDVQRTAGLECR